MYYNNIFIFKIGLELTICHRDLRNNMSLFQDTFSVSKAENLIWNGYNSTCFESIDNFNDYCGSVCVK